MLADACWLLPTCSVAPLVASGAADRVIVIWDLRDADASSLSATGISNSAASAGRTNDACGSSKGAAKDGKEGSASEGKGDDDGDGDIVMEDGPGGAQQQHEGVGGGGPTAPPELEGVILLVAKALWRVQARVDWAVKGNEDASRA